jgi:uncharacterized protein YjiK
MMKYPLIMLAMLTFSCNNPMKKSEKSADMSSSEKEVKETESGQYFELPPELKEISGITFLSPDVVLAIQDEQGILYHYNIKDRKVIKQFEFGKPDDYEDLVRVDKDVFVVGSNGTIIQIIDFESAKPQVKKFKTALSKENDIEGLAYEPTKHRLLLGAKADGLDSDETTKAIYAFDLNTMQLNSTPVYQVKLSEIEGYFKGDALVESSKKFLKALGNQNLNKIFRTSAITVNPKNNMIFILSSINNLIAVLTPDGKLSHIIQFEGKEYKQPEGIAFAENGKLYISNEAGKNGNANIIELEYAN